MASSCRDRLRSRITERQKDLATRLRYSANPHEPNALYCLTGDDSGDMAFITSMIAVWKKQHRSPPITLTNMVTGSKSASLSSVFDMFRPSSETELRYRLAYARKLHKTRTTTAAPAVLSHTKRWYAHVHELSPIRGVRAEYKRLFIKSDHDPNDLHYNTHCDNTLCETVLAVDEAQRVSCPTCHKRSYCNRFCRNEDKDHQSHCKRVHSISSSSSSSSSLSSTSTSSSSSSSLSSVSLLAMSSSCSASSKSKSSPNHYHHHSPCTSSSSSTSALAESPSQSRSQPLLLSPSSPSSSSLSSSSLSSFDKKKKKVKTRGVAVARLVSSDISPLSTKTTLTSTPTTTCTTSEKRHLTGHRRRQHRDQLFQSQKKHEALQHEYREEMRLLNQMRKRNPLTAKLEQMHPVRTTETETETKIVKTKTVTQSRTGRHSSCRVHISTWQTMLT